MTKIKEATKKRRKKNILVRRRETSVTITGASPEVQNMFLREKIYNAIVTGDTRNTKIVVVHLSMNYLEEGLFAVWVLYENLNIIRRAGGAAEPSFPEHLFGDKTIVESILTVGMTKELDTNYMRLLLSAARAEIRNSKEAQNLKRALKRLRNS